MIWMKISIQNEIFFRSVSMAFSQLSREIKAHHLLKFHAEIIFGSTYVLNKAQESKLL